MGDKYKDIPGFPGDGDSDIELHHADPIYWTTKMTVWSIAMVVVFVLLAAVVFVMAV